MRLLKYAGLSLTAILLGFFVSVFVFLKTRIPPVSGEFAVEGLASTATITRDAYGVPHIQASDADDAYFALGYAQAQDRLFQMDFYRRAARGELSEILGAELLDADKYLRTLGFLRTARRQYSGLSRETTALVEAFSRGVNFFIRHGPMPLEFTLLGYGPRPWKAEDSIAIANLLAFQLASWAFTNETNLYLIQRRLGAEKAREFLPAYPKVFTPIIARGGPGGGRRAAISPCSRRFIDGFLLRTIASNNWVIHGRRTESGKPLLGDDSHEDGPELPTQWHMAHLTGPGMDAAGAMFPGTPLFVWGHNRRIAWGLTNFNLDNQDLYLERIHPDNDRLVMYRSKWVELEHITERIVCKGDGGMKNIDYLVRVTPHGPIINDIEKDLGAEPLSLRRVEDEQPSIAEALYRLERAGNWNEFVDALSRYGAGPQHFVYADVDGNIGYVGAGRCPVRRGSSGVLPSPGWDGSCEWAGYYPFEMMPRSCNPPKAYIVTANNRPFRGRLPIPYSEYWECPYRAERIAELIESKERLTMADMKAMQLDIVSSLARKLVPVFLSALRGSKDPSLSPYIARLESWNCRVDDRSPATCIYELMLNRLPYEAFHDELGDGLFKRLIKDKIGMTNTLVDLLTRRTDSALFDRVDTPKKETMNDAILQAFAYAREYLEKEFGNDMRRWKWGSLHRIEFSHPFGQEPMLRPFFNYGPFPFEGDEHTINRAGYANENPFKVNITASIRYIADLSAIHESLIVLSSGQSAHLLSAHRTDMCDLFMKGEYIPWHFSSQQYAADSKGVTTLRPR